MSFLNSGCGQLRLPFQANQSLHDAQKSYWSMLARNFCPHFKFSSFSFLMIAITFLLLIVPQFIFPATGYSTFLQYRSIPHVYLNPIQIKHVNHMYIYQTFTAMFFHTGWRHWLSNAFSIILVIVSMQHYWTLTSPFMILGGIIANCFYTLTHDNILMGFSGAISCGIGLYIGMFLGNLSYVQRQNTQTIANLFINCLFVFFLVFSSNPTSSLVHFLGFLMGIVYSLAWIPKLQPSELQNTIGKICKILSIVLSIAPIVLIFLHPIGTAVQQYIII